MKNERELFQALFSGKKLYQDHWNDHEFIHMVDGKIIDESGDKYVVVSNRFEEFKIKNEKIEVFCIWKEFKEHSRSSYFFPYSSEEMFDWKKLVGRKTKLTIEFLDDK